MPQPLLVHMSTKFAVVPRAVYSSSLRSGWVRFGSVTTLGTGTILFFLAQDLRYMMQIFWKDRPITGVRGSISTPIKVEFVRIL